MFLPFRAQKWALALALAAWPALVQADIGDTVADLRAHYGSDKVVGNQMLFEVCLVNGKIVRAVGQPQELPRLSVTVYFDGTTSAMEVFTPNTSDPAKSDLTQKQIDTIMALAGDGQSWNQTQSASGKPTWLRTDNKVLARLSQNTSGAADGTTVLVIMVNRK